MFNSKNQYVGMSAFEIRAQKEMNRRARWRGFWSVFPFVKVKPSPTAKQIMDDFYSLVRQYKNEAGQNEKD